MGVSVDSHAAALPSQADADVLAKAFLDVTFYLTGTDEIAAGEIVKTVHDRGLQEAFESSVYKKLEDDEWGRYAQTVMSKHGTNIVSAILREEMSGAELKRAEDLYSDGADLHRATRSEIAYRALIQSNPLFDLSDDGTKVEMGVGTVIFGAAGAILAIPSAPVAAVIAAGGVAIVGLGLAAYGLVSGAIEAAKGAVKFLSAENEGESKDALDEGLKGMRNVALSGLALWGSGLMVKGALLKGIPNIGFMTADEAALMTGAADARLVPLGGDVQAASRVILVTRDEELPATRSADLETLASGTSVGSKVPEEEWATQIVMGEYSRVTKLVELVGDARAFAMLKARLGDGIFREKGLAKFVSAHFEHDYKGLLAVLEDVDGIEPEVAVTLFQPHDVRVAEVVGSKFFLKNPEAAAAILRDFGRGKPLTITLPVPEKTPPAGIDAVQEFIDGIGKLGGEGPVRLIDTRAMEFQQAQGLVNVLFQSHEWRTTYVIVLEDVGFQGQGPSISGLMRSAAHQGSFEESNINLFVIATGHHGYQSHFRNCFQEASPFWDVFRGIRP